MQQLCSTIGDGLGIATLGAVILYAPFSKTYARSILVPFSLCVAWSLVRVLTIVIFKEPCPPLVGFAFIPFIYGACGAVLRLLRVILTSRLPKRGGESQQ